jgi:hypothetical protein
MRNSNEDLNAEHERLLREAGLRPLSPTWAKLEILIGLAAAAIGLLCGVRGVQDLAAAGAWPLIAASVLVQTLGGYLALAGQRSHLTSPTRQRGTNVVSRIRPFPSLALRACAATAVIFISRKTSWPPIWRHSCAMRPTTDVSHEWDLGVRSMPGRAPRRFAGSDFGNCLAEWRPQPARSVGEYDGELASGPPKRPFIPNSPPQAASWGTWRAWRGEFFV